MRLFQRFRPCSVLRAVRRSRKSNGLYLERLEDRTLPSTLTVTNLLDSGVGSLRDTLAGAADGDTIQFADDVRGTLTLTSGQLEVQSNVSILGPGAESLTIDGNSASRVFDVAATDVYLFGLTIAHGYASNTRTVGESVFGEGGGIYQEGRMIGPNARLIIDGCVVQQNTVAGTSSTGPASANGGGISTGDFCDLHLIASTISNNLATGSNTMGSGSGSAYGGGIATGTRCQLSVLASAITDNSAVANNPGGDFSTFSGGGGIDTSQGPSSGTTLTLTDSVVAHNSAVSQMQTYAGGIDSDGLGRVTVTRCSIDDNAAIVVQGSSSADRFASGGGIRVGGEDGRTAGTLVMVDSSVTNNVARVEGDTSGGFQDGQAQGGGMYAYDLVTLSRCRVLANQVAAPLLSSGGGAVLRGTQQVSSCTFADNSAVATGQRQDGPGEGRGGGLFLPDGTLELTACTVNDNSASGFGMGSLTYGGFGGGIYNQSPNLTIYDSTLANNGAIGGMTGSGVGGGIYQDGLGLLVLASTINGNGVGGAPDSTDGGGIYVSRYSSQSSTRLVSTIVAGNTSGASATPSDIVVFMGSTLDTARSRFNLIGTGGSGGLVDGVNGNQVGVADPGLGILGDYGGPTQTIPLLLGSPALQTGYSALLGTPDQRGIVREGAVDIGAYQATPMTDSAEGGGKETRDAFWTSDVIPLLAFGKKTEG